jgi:hypothetical protein
MRAVVRYFEVVGIGLDIFLCAILTGQKATTLSMAAARAEPGGLWVACRFCAFLPWFVQRNHCADQRAGIGMAGINYFRAIVGLVILALLLWWAGWWVLLLSFKLLAALVSFIFWMEVKHGS